MPPLESTIWAALWSHMGLGVVVHRDVVATLALVVTTVSVTTLVLGRFVPTVGALFVVLHCPSTLHSILRGIINFPIVGMERNIWERH